jgi:hypothetical protein
MIYYNSVKLSTLARLLTNNYMTPSTCMIFYHMYSNDFSWILVMDTV